MVYNKNVVSRLSEASLCLELLPFSIKITRVQILYPQNGKLLFPSQLWGKC